MLEFEASDFYCKIEGILLRNLEVEAMTISGPDAMPEIRYTSTRSIRDITCEIAQWVTEFVNAIAWKHREIDSTGNDADARQVPPNPIKTTVLDVNGKPKKVELFDMRRAAPFILPDPITVKPEDIIPTEVRSNMVDVHRVGTFDMDTLLVCGRYPSVGYDGNALTQRIIKGMNLKPVKVWFNPPYTTVQFDDGSKVTVEQEDFEDSKFNEYAGFCCAIAKKLFGDTTTGIKAFEAAKARAEANSPQHKKAERKARMKEEKRKKQEMKIKERERRIREELDSMRIKREAEKRLKEEE